MIKLHYAPKKVDADEVCFARKIIDRHENLSIKVNGQKYDLTIALGGDGTFLHELNKRNSCVLPIAKKGSVAYGADNDVDSLADCLNKLEVGQYQVDVLAMLEARLNRQFVGNAVNDVYIKARNKTVTCRIDFMTDGFVSRGDGVIVYTPHGSTGYNRSVRGPKIDSKAAVIGVSQIAPVIVETGDPYVIPDHYKISIKVERGDGDLYRDGEPPIKVKSGDVLDVSKALETARLVRVNRQTVCEKLLRKQKDFARKCEENIK